MAASLEFSVRGASAVSPGQLEACARLFSENYGVWGKGAPQKLLGSRVRLSANKLMEQYLFDDSCCLATATTLDGNIVGHAFATKFCYEDVCFSWITQLVVASQFRNQGIASKLCQLSWDVDAVAGCGIVTSHPHAIKALEKATRRRCKHGMMDCAHSLLQASCIPYLHNRNVSCGQSGGICTVDTGFFVDHTDVDKLISIQSPRLGLKQLEAGHEFVAFTLKSWSAERALTRTPHSSREASPTISSSCSGDEHTRELAKIVSLFVVCILISKGGGPLRSTATFRPQLWLVWGLYISYSIVWI